MLQLGAGAVLLHAGRLSAQSIPKDFVTDVRAGVSDVFAVWGAPFHASGRDYAISAAALGMTGVLALSDANIARWVRRHPDDPFLRALRPLREGQGDYFVKATGGSGHTPGAFGVYTVGLLVRSPAIRDVGMGCLAAAEAHTIFRQVVYAAVSRERPLYRETVNDSLIEREGRPYEVHVPGQTTPYDNSFFSGHAASVFSCVTFVNARFHLSYVEPVLWAVAAALSVGRAADQHHYASDVVVGSLIGFAAGKLVGDRSVRRADRRANAKNMIVPDTGHSSTHSWQDGIYVSRQHTGLVLGWRTSR